MDELKQDTSNLGEEKQVAEKPSIVEGKIEEIKEFEKPQEIRKIERPFITIEQMYQIGRRFAERMFSAPEIVEKLKTSKLVISFKYYEDFERWGVEEPEVTVDLTVEPVQFYTGPCDKKPDVIMRMHADTAHRFWMQKLNLMIAITKGEIKAKGPIPKIMRLFPIIKPSFPLYKETLQEMGYIELLNYP